MTKKQKKVCNAQNYNIQIYKLIEHIVTTVSTILTTKQSIKISDIVIYEKMAILNTQLIVLWSKRTVLDLKIVFLVLDLQYYDRFGQHNCVR